MTWEVPTITAIERTTLVLAAASAVVLLALASRATALGCLVGGVVMTANLAALAVIGRAILGAGRAGGAASRVALVVAPLKLLLLVAVVYLLLTRARIDVGGFMLGVLTQFAAIFIETWRGSSFAR